MYKVSSRKPVCAINKCLVNRPLSILVSGESDNIFSLFII